MILYGLNTDAEVLRDENLNFISIDYSSVQNPIVPFIVFRNPETNATGIIDIFSGPNNTPIVIPDANIRSESGDEDYINNIISKKIRLRTFWGSAETPTGNNPPIEFYHNTTGIQDKLSTLHQLLQLNRSELITLIFTATSFYPPLTRVKKQNGNTIYRTFKAYRYTGGEQIYYMYVAYLDVFSNTQDSNITLNDVSVESFTPDRTYSFMLIQPNPATSRYIPIGRITQGTIKYRITISTTTGRTLLSFTTTATISGSTVNEQGNFLSLIRHRFINANSNIYLHIEFSPVFVPYLLGTPSGMINVVVDIWYLRGQFTVNNVPLFVLDTAPSGASALSFDINSNLRGLTYEIFIPFNATGIRFPVPKYKNETIKYTLTNYSGTSVTLPIEGYYLDTTQNTFSNTLLPMNENQSFHIIYMVLPPTSGTLPSIYLPVLSGMNAINAFTGATVGPLPVTVTAPTLNSQLQQGVTAITINKNFLTSPSRIFYYTTISHKQQIEAFTFSPPTAQPNFDFTSIVFNFVNVASQLSQTLVIQHF